MHKPGSGCWGIKFECGLILVGYSLKVLLVSYKMLLKYTNQVRVTTIRV